MEDEKMSDTIRAVGDAFYPFYVLFRDSPFGLFAFLAVAAFVAFVFLARNQPPWLRMAVILLIFSGLIALGYMTIPRGQVVVQESNGAPLAVVEEVAPRLDLSGESISQLQAEIEPQTVVQAAIFDNRDGFLLPRPTSFREERSWFAYVASFSERDRAITHATQIAEQHRLKTVVFQYGDRVNWGVALATWTTEAKAKQAASFARAEGIESTSYAARIPRNIFDTYPTLYELSNLE